MPEKNNLKKGELAEEKLRQYFKSIGYFVVRGIDCKYQGYDVTDVDLWLYSRPSPVSRERTNVDIKMKKTPQALERIFWAKGLQTVLGLEKCIVATTDKREHILEFGIENDVAVFDGNFMGKLNSSERYGEYRLTEEEFIEELDSGSVGDLGGAWKSRYIKSKSLLLNKLNFDGVNEHLSQISYFLNECALTSANDAAFRSLYICLSYFLVTLDYSIKDISYKDHHERGSFISDGVRYGERGKERSDEVVSMASALMDSFIAGHDVDLKAIQAEVYSQFSNIPSESIGEYFGNTKTMRNIFSLANAFEDLAFAKELQEPANLTTEVQAVIALLCDFNNIDRKLIFNRR